MMLESGQLKFARCLVVLLPSQDLQSIRITPSASHLQLIFHPSKRIFLPLPLCLSSLKPSLSHSLSIMLLSCSDSALFFCFFPSLSVSYSHYIGSSWRWCLQACDLDPNMLNVCACGVCLISPFCSWREGRIQISAKAHIQITNT